MSKAPITVETTVNVPVDKAWEIFTGPEHVMKWNNASEDWHTPKAENDLRDGGKFCYTMAAKDGSMSFDFSGVYDEVVDQAMISYILDDGRTVSISFMDEGNSTRIVESFEPETENPLEMQRGGWQAILDNYKKYAESLG